MAAINVNILFAEKRRGRLKIKHLDYNLATHLLNYYFCIKRAGDKWYITLHGKKPTYDINTVCRTPLLAYKTLIIPVSDKIVPEGVYQIIINSDTEWVMERRLWMPEK